MKILVVSYFFAGESNMGATRIRRLVRHWVQNGDEVTVLTHECGRILPEAEATGAKRIPVQALDLPELADRVRRLIGKGSPPQTEKAPEGGISRLTSKPSRLTGLIHRLLCIPDKFRPWYGPGVKAGYTLIKTVRPDLIFVSIEPRTDALIAARLAKKFKLPLAVEYRDLWNGSPYRHANAPTPLHDWLQKRMEAKVVRSASLLAGVCNGISDYLKTRYARENVPVFTNFFDEREYPQPVTAKRTKEKPFRVAYIGQLYGERGPYAFLEGFQQFIEQNKLSPEDIVFEWVGPVSGQGDLVAWIESRKLEKYISYHGTLSHSDALACLQRVHVSLVLVAPDDSIHVPGKLYEAMGARTPVLLVAPKGSEALRILEETGSGLHAECEAGQVAMRLHELYAGFQRGKEWVYHEEKRAEYSNVVLQEHYLGALGEIRQSRV